MLIVDISSLRSNYFVLNSFRNKVKFINTFKREKIKAIFIDSNSITTKQMK